MALLHTFLINRLLIFNFFSFIMYIEKPRNRFRNSFLDPTFIFLPLFSFRKGPELTGHQPGPFPASGRSHLVLWCGNGGNAIGPARLVAMIRSAYWRVHFCRAWAASRRGQCVLRYSASGNILWARSTGRSAGPTANSFFGAV